MAERRSEAGGGGRAGGRSLLVVGGLVLLFGLLDLRHALDGDVFLSTEVLRSATEPWREDVPPAPHNPYLSDHTTIYLSWLVHTRQELRAGRLPLWSGHSFLGVPYHGNFSVGLLSPFTWAFVVLPFEWAFAIVALAKWCLGGIGAALLARRLGVRGPGLWLAALGFGYCGYQVVWIQSALTHVLCFAPWCLWSIHRFVEQPSRRGAALVALLQFLQVVGGHPETSFFVAVGSALFGGVLALGRPLGARLGGIAGGMALGAGAAAVAILPFLEYSARSDALLRLRAGRMELFAPWIEPTSLGGVLLATAATALCFVLASLRRRGGGLLAVGVAALALRALGLRPLLDLLALPDLHGSPLDGRTYLGPLTYTDVTGGTVGAVIAILAVLAVVLRRDRITLALALPTVLFLARFVRLPYLADLEDHLPVVQQTAATRSLGMVALSLCLLAARALPEVRARPKEALQAGARVLLFAAVVAAPFERFVAALDPAGAASAGLQVAARYEPTAQDVASLGDLPVQGRAPPGTRAVILEWNGHRAGLADVDENGDYRWDWVGVVRAEEGRYRLRVLDAADERPIGSATLDLLRPRVPEPTWGWGLAAVLVAGLCVRLRPRQSAWVLPLLAAAELFGFGADYNDVTPRDRMPGPVEPIARLVEIQEREGPFRILGARTALQPNLHYLFGLQALRGYDALEPFDTVQILARLFTGHRERIWFEQDFSTMDLESPLADVLNLRFVLSEETPDAGWKEVWREGSLGLFENEDVLPRAYPVEGVWSLEAHDGALPPPELETDPAFLRHAVIVEHGPDRRFEGSAAVRSLDYSHGRIEADVDSEQGTFLVVSENAAPGWKLWVDGEERPLEKAHLCFLGAELPAGTHHVRFEYRPMSVFLGAGISVACAALVLLLALGRTGRPRNPLEVTGSRRSP